jgi:hypothetical protein
LGEKGLLQGQLKDIEFKCKEDFKCELSELPGFIQHAKNEAEESLSNAEIMLGLKTGTIKEAPKSIPVIPEKENVVIPKSKQSQKDEDSL